MFLNLLIISAVVGLLLPIGIYLYIDNNEKKNGKTRLKTITKRIVIVELCFAIPISLGALAINQYVKHVGGKRIISAGDAAKLEDVDCIIVLGCLVYSNGTPSDSLADRLTVGVELYKTGAASKIIMSGDHGKTSYNEVQVMKNYAVNLNVPSEDIFMDHAGFSTYESIYRAKEVFCAKKIIIVTQEYHIYRALYIAKQLGLDAYGVSSDLHKYVNQTDHDVREALARVKDFLTGVFKPKPTYLGETIPVSGNGNITND